MKKAYVLDKDGTLVNLDRPIDGAADFLTQVDHYVVLTNPGEKSASQVAEELTRVMGVRVPPERVLTARDHMATLLLREGRFRAVKTVGVHHEAFAPLRWEDPVPEDCSGTCVALFSDGRIDDYAETIAATATHMRRGAVLYATSVDRSVAQEDGSMRIGPGVFVRSVLAFLGLPLGAVRVFGKGGTDTSIGELAVATLRKQGFTGTSREVHSVGDRFDTDVRLGNSLRWNTCLVESGCHTEGDASLYPADLADSVACSLRDLAGGEEATLKDTLRDFVRVLARTAGPAVLDALSKVERMLKERATRLTPAPRRIRSLPSNLDSLG